jgi:hypothetical protein
MNCCTPKAYIFDRALAQVVPWKIQPYNHLLGCVAIVVAPIEVKVV